MLSVLSGHTDCVYSLLNKGASVEAKDKWGRTALHRGVSHYIIIHSHIMYAVQSKTFSESEYFCYVAAFY